MRHARTPFLLALLVAASGADARVSFAQIGYAPSSIEWLTDSSAVVVRASVAKLAYKDRAPAAGEIRSQWQWVTVTLKVHAALKGKASKNIVFVFERPRGDKEVAEWKKSGQSLLWFLAESGNEKEEPPRDYPTRTRSKLCLNHYLELGSPKTRKRLPHPVFSMDFQVLDDEDKVLEAVKTEAASRRDPSKRRASQAIWLSMPYDVAARSGKAGDANQLCVPVNDRLEQLARTWVRSKEDWKRRAGVLALGQFESAANIAILKGMLSDKASWVEHKEDRDPGERVYYIREAAYNTLRKWKVSVPKPILRESPKD